MHPARHAVHYLHSWTCSNHPGAMFRLGMSLLRGELGQSKNPRYAVKWLKLAAKYANEKYPQALFELALLHDKGVHNVVWPDHEYLLELLTQGAALGHGPSQYKLGEAFEYGNFGAPIDPGRSVYYYSLAAANGNLEVGSAFSFKLARSVTDLTSLRRCIGDVRIGRMVSYGRGRRQNRLPPHTIRR